MPSPRVLILPSWYPTAQRPASGIFFKEQARALADAGADVTVLFPEDLSLRKLAPATLRTHRWQFGRADEDGVPTCRAYSWNLFPRLPFRHALWLRRMERLADWHMARAGRPDVLHAQSALWGGVAARAIARRTGIPYVVTEHSSRYRRGMVSARDLRLTREVYADATAVLCISRAAADDLVALDLLPPDGFQIVPLGVPFDFFTLPPPGARPDPPPFRFVDVTLMNPIKRLDWLLRAFARAFPDDATTELALTGEGPERPRLEGLARELGLGGRVRFLGAVDRAGVRDALWSAHAFAHSSAYETFGVALIEAQATGLPVLSTACGGPQDTVAPDTGLLVPVDDADAFVAALRRLRAARHDPAAIRASARVRFASGSVAARLLNVYAEAVKRPR